MAGKLCLTALTSALLLVKETNAVACPYAEAFKRGLLDSDLADKFEAVRNDPENADKLIGAHHAETKRADPQQGGLAGLVGPIIDGVIDLPLGGGLLNGVLQPLSGLLEDLDIPTPQKQENVEIPGDDPKHQFKAPGPTDQRGICPTLNALANHGYLSRDGITSFAEAANAIQIAYGASYDLSVFLSAVGLLAGGDIVSGKYSIGGADDRVPNTLGPALGLGKHGVFEIDGSITREDRYLGNNANFILQRWDEYVNISETHGDGQFNAEANAYDNGYRYDISRETNPQFLAGAIWFIVSHAERVFVYELLANGTETGPGDASYRNIAPFFLNETFPEEWYKRGVGFSLASTMQSGLQMFLSNPRELGSNDGLHNFVPLQTNLTDLSASELGCFALKNILDVAPNQLQPAIVKNLDVFNGFLKGVLAPFFTNDGFFDCDVGEFVAPSPEAGKEDTEPGVGAIGSPVNGKYPGVGEVKPDAQPS